MLPSVVILEDFFFNVNTLNYVKFTILYKAACFFTISTRTVLKSSFLRGDVEKDPTHIPAMYVDSSLRTLRFNPLSPPDALKHHFTSLKTDLIFLQLRVSE